MPIPKFSLRLLLLLVLLACHTRGQQLPAAITTDPAPDKNFPATMEAPDIPSHGARLNAVLYLASGAGPHPTVVLLHGFPGNEKNLDLAYAIRRAGGNVLIPHYRGSWGSGGSFSFANAMEDTQAASEFLRDPDNVKKYRIDPKRIVLMGHSMGGFMAAFAGAHDPQISAVAMISAWNIGPTVLRPADNGRADSYRNASPRLAGTTPDGLMAEAKDNAAKWDYIDYAGLLRTRPVLVVESKDRNRSDNHAMAEALSKAGNQKVTEKYIETDHTYSDHRIALQVVVLEWLESLAAPPAK
jgi:dipeptidyl aminopeptidase/acylaminoacyl peptidase